LSVFQLPGQSIADPSEFDPDGSIATAIDAGRTLPSHWYTSDAVFAAEQRLIFRRQWEYVGHLGQVARPGDFFTCNASGVPVVVTRDRAEKIHAFINICRHRHNPVALGSGNQSLLVCQYHAWSYKLDGTFNRAPRSKEDPNFRCDDLNLLELPVGQLGQMIFVNPSGDAPPLEDALGPIPALARQHGIPLDAAVYRASRSMEFNSNWKLPWDNNVECYHCPTVHKSWYRQAQLDPEHVYSFPVGPLQFQHVVDQRATAVTDNHFYSWPAFCLTTDSTTGVSGTEAAAEIRPSGAPQHRDRLHNYFMWKFVPLSPRKTRIEWHLFADDGLTSTDIDQLFEGLLSVVAEDQEICDGVQRSHESGVGGLGTLIPAIDSEFTTLTWERLVHRALTEPDVGLYEPLLERTATWPAS
jgi:phenylpropionate dioxygenase-like ring-hydroxylating dioxygenase large terminal subunit